MKEISSLKCGLSNGYLTLKMMQNKKSDFDTYWEGESKNKNRNRIRVGKQYQASLPALLKPGESDGRSFEDLETLKWMPNKLSDEQIDKFIFLTKSLMGTNDVPNNSVPKVESSYEGPENTDACDDSSNGEEAFIECEGTALKHEAGIEIQPMKGRPKLTEPETETCPSSMGSLKFFMDGQLVLKLNAKSEGSSAYQWVPSQDCPKPISPPKKGKRYKKHSSSSSCIRPKKSPIKLEDGHSYFSGATVKTEESPSSSDSFLSLKDKPLDLSSPCKSPE